MVSKKQVVQRTRERRRASPQRGGARGSAPAGRKSRAVDRRTVQTPEAAALRSPSCSSLLGPPLTHTPPGLHSRVLLALLDEVAEGVAAAPLFRRTAGFEAQQDVAAAAAPAARGCDLGGRGGSHPHLR